MGYIYLAVAILGEVTATSALKASQEFTRLGPSILAVCGYGIALYFMTLSLRTIPIGITYAVWSGLGIVLITFVAAKRLREIPDLPALLGISMIVSGVIVLCLFSKMKAVS